jgi:hypothetical protein
MRPNKRIEFAHLKRKGKMFHTVLVEAPDELKRLCEEVIAYSGTYCLGRERRKQR